MKRAIQRVFRTFGLDLVRHREVPPDASPEDARILRAVHGYTMTSVERQLALIAAVRYVVKRGLAGPIVECGVWRGGSSMAAAMTLQEMGDTDRELFLYDTFEGMSAPTKWDRAKDGVDAETKLAAEPKGTGIWCYADLDDVERNMRTTGYPTERTHLIKGRVEDTIPAQSPTSPIAILRLDTDWYESTKHELEHLFPALVDGGVLIIDDYGHWEGARKAVDEYLATLPHPYLLQRIDYTGRILVKG